LESKSIEKSDDSGRVKTVISVHGELMAHLYVNSKGQEVRSFSYSAGSLFHECAQKFKLSRLDGWRERELRASMEFGKAIENAIQAYHVRQNVERAIAVFYDGLPDREG